MEIAIEYYNKSLKIQETLPTPNHSSMATMNYNIARAYEQLQNYTTALPHAEYSLNSARLAFGSDHPEVKKNQQFLEKIRRKQ
jgi:uncharacterized glyoxalase superfamily protein PhnB